jgi:hypothetical protein
LCPANYFRMPSIRGNGLLPGNRSRYRALPTRCTNRGQNHWTRMSAVLASATADSCRSTVVSRAPQPAALQPPRKETRTAAPRADVAKGSCHSADSLQTPPTAMSWQSHPLHSRMAARFARNWVESPGWEYLDQESIRAPHLVGAIFQDIPAHTRRFKKKPIDTFYDFRAFMRSATSR